MNYEESVNYIDSLSPTVLKPGLERFALYMEEHAKPQERCPSLHVAGTNGKGSVVCMLAETLNKSGLKAGRYTGPHLLQYNERFQLQGKNISDLEFATICSALRVQSEEFGNQHPERGPLTWFELITAIAFEFFAKGKSDVSVIEVGLGGRWDATNVLTAPLATAIVTVGLDHTQILGSTVEEIAKEKAGILKQSVPLVTACKGRALEAISELAASKNVPVICVSAVGQLTSATGSRREESYLESLQKRFAELSTPIASSLARQSGYQRLNATVAAALLGIWEIESGKQCLENFDSALDSFFWPGRLQYFKNEELILDGAHNEDGARALKECLDEFFPNKQRCFVLCFYQSKHFKEIMSALVRPGDLVFASQTTGLRPVVSASEIVRTAQELGARSNAYDTLKEAFEAAALLDSRDYIHVGAGSFAAVVAGLNFLGFENTEDSQRASSTLWQPAGA